MAKIIGLGSWLPEKIRTNDAWTPEIIESFQDHQKRALNDVTSNGIVPGIDQFTLDCLNKEDPIFVGGVERRVVEDGMPSWQAELQAAQAAIANAGINKDDIGAIFSFSFSTDRVSVGSPAKIAYELGIQNVYGYEINAACASQISQFEIAEALVDSGKVKYVLLVASNFMTRCLPLGHPASPGVGDGATAVLVGDNANQGHKIISTQSRSHGDFWDAVAFRRRSGENQEWYQAGGDFYVGSYDHAKARELIQLTAVMGDRTIREALERANLTPKDLDFVIAVQPRKWLPLAMAKLLGLRDDQTFQTYEKYAHLGCCGPVVNLMEAADGGLIKKGNLVALYAQGAGFTRSAIIIEW